MGFACQRTSPEVATPAVVEDLGDGKSQVGTVRFQGVELEPETVEDSLQQTEIQIKKDIYNGVEQYWEPLEDVKSLFSTYTEFIEYQYGSNDERNTLYLTEDKKEVFHQLTGSAYDLVVAERNYHEVSAGIFIAGATELRYAEMWNRYPTPDYLEHNAQILFGEQVRDTVRHLTEGGRDKLERLIAHHERSHVSGMYTEMALQELQWRFPREYPQPIASQKMAELPLFLLYRGMMSSPMISQKPEWSTVYMEQMQEIERLSDGNAVVDAVRLTCAESMKPYVDLGRAPLELCVLRQLGNQDMLYVQYPGSKLPEKMQKAQKAVFDAVQASADSIVEWEDTEYGRFWKKEATMMAREIQYDKMTAMRQQNREGTLLSWKVSLWEFQPEELMDESTATILDAHLAQLERELRILRYDLNALGEEARSTQMRQLFVLFPQRLQEWEFFVQACLFAFPENSEVRARMELALASTYADLIAALDAYKTPETERAVQRWQKMMLPLVVEISGNIEAERKRNLALDEALGTVELQEQWKDVQSFVAKQTQ